MSAIIVQCEYNVWDWKAWSIAEVEGALIETLRDGGWIGFVLVRS